MTEMTYAYVFSSTAVKEKPDTEITRLLEKAMRHEKLSRQEKDSIAGILYGIGRAGGPAYRVAGWVWYMSSHLHRILVKYDYNSYWLAYYAPDKTSLRRALSDASHIEEMIYTS